MSIKETTVKKQVLLYALLPILTTFLLLEFLDYHENRSQAVRLAKNGAEEKSEALANRVENLVSEAGTVANITAQALTVSEVWTEQELFEMLRRNVSGNPLIYGAAIAFEPRLFEGRDRFSPYAYRAGNEVKTIDIGKGSYDYTQPQWEWYNLPKKLKRSVWTEPYFDKGAGNIEMVTYSVPFFRHGRLAGIATIDLDLSRLPERAKITSEANKDFYILSQGRNFVFHHNASWLGKPLGRSGQGFSAKSLSQLLAALQKKYVGVFESKMDDGSVVWLSTHPIKAAGWDFVVKVDVRAEMQGVESSLRNMIIRSVIVLLFALGALMLFIHRILEPITRLAIAAKEVEDGKPFSMPIADSRNEVGVLAKNLGSMTQKLQESEARFRHILEVSPIAVGIVHLHAGNLLFANNSYHTLFNTHEGMVGDLTPSSFYACQADYEEILRQLRQGGNVYDRLVELTFPGVGTRWALASYLPIQYRGEAAVLGWFYDITARKRLEENLQLAAMVYENASEAMTVTDEENRIIAINPAFTAITGFTESDVLGKTPRMLCSSRQNAAFYRNIGNSIAVTGGWQGEVWNRHKNGEEYVAWVTVNTITNDHGNVYRRVALFSDITEKKQKESLIWNQANFDQLTQLPNRHLFLQRLEQEILKINRDQSLMALLFIDLDRFKEVNDTLGHDVGDQLLVEASKRLVYCIRDYDTLARLGGDEFTVILSELQDPADAAHVAQKIIDTLSSPFSLVGHDVFVSASIGIALYPVDAMNAKDLIKHADQAMYRAKGEGRSCCYFFTQSLQQQAEYRMYLGGDLRHALKRNQFFVQYQPIVCLKTSTIRKAEALLRWRHPEYGLVSPADFIPVAEETRMINEIGDWVFEQAVEQVAQWQSLTGSDFQISINKSPLQFSGSGHNHERWVAHLAEKQLGGNAIAVEITEGLLMNSDAMVTNKLLQFRDAGIQVAIDDFGTGYSALSYLNKFDIDYLKIDQSFTRNLAPDSHEMALCEAIVSMAHKLGLKVIAEGVETVLQHDLLTQIGCDYGQGYFYSRPISPPDFEKLLSPENFLVRPNSLEHSLPDGLPTERSLLP